ncbi:MULTISPECIES: pyruvate kinase [Alphaproteobacteria]|uniref:pyruvate kinase n=1 Tax=Alphaproteobacteria TaxID=28211 RepID=UPI001911135B
MARALDLAVELGFGRIRKVQKNIPWRCEAAHVPVIWATQVLAGMVEQGAPRRTEATDAARGQRAEWVMLNKDHSSSKQGVSSAMCCAA